MKKILSIIFALILSGCTLFSSRPGIDDVAGATVDLYCNSLEKGPVTGERGLSDELEKDDSEVQKIIKNHGFKTMEEYENAVKEYKNDENFYSKTIGSEKYTQCNADFLHMTKEEVEQFNQNFEEKMTETITDFQKEKTEEITNPSEPPEKIKR